MFSSLNNRKSICNWPTAPNDITVLAQQKYWQLRHHLTLGFVTVFHLNLNNFVNRLCWKFLNSLWLLIHNLKFVVLKSYCSWISSYHERIKHQMTNTYWIILFGSLGTDNSIYITANINFLINLPRVQDVIGFGIILTTIPEYELIAKGRQGSDTCKVWVKSVSLMQVFLLYW